MDSNETKIQQAIQWHQQGQLDQAQAVYRAVLKECPKHSQAMQLLGVTFSQRGDYAEALKWMNQALALSPNDANIWNNRSKTLLESHQWEIALLSAKQALVINPNHVDAWFNKGCIYKQMLKLSDAVQSYSRVIELNPNHAEALKYRSVCLRELGHYNEALPDCEKAFLLTPNDDELPLLRALLYFEHGYYKLAAEDFREAIRIQPNHLGALFIGSQCMRVSGDMRGAADCLLKVYEIKPDYSWLLGELVHTLYWLCDWSEPKWLAELISKINQDEKAINPFSALTLFDDPKLLHQVSQRFARAVLGTSFPQLKANPKHKKIKVGFYSADFQNHAMSMIIPEAIENLNRDRFEIHLFSIAQSPEDAYRQRLRQTSDHFIEVEKLSHKEVAEKSRELGIDIAIDLMGYTAKHRHKIFVERCAPVQAAWIGMPGTSGSPAIDYIIADPVVIPEESRQHYSEHVVYLPCYWPNDSKRKIATETPKREAMGLPNGAFVFCSFNVSCKILPETFYGWMRILAATPNSVLWLLKTSDEAMENLRKAAESKGISAEQLIFAPKVIVDEHLARHRLADLFIDTFPYNAHTTAVDALWAGLPLLTRSGQSFPSRVAASLLNRLGLPELITDNQADFEARAIYLANEGRSELKAIRKKLAILRKTSPLFDGKAFAKDLESAFQAMYDRSQAGLEPDFISIV